MLRGSTSTFDLIISDLFIPWKAGTGNLYSVEHYRVAHKRLNPDGMYVQWLPLYQLTKGEFLTIARSMQQVFPTVSMWRGNFSGNRPVVAFIGHQQSAQLSPNTPILMTSRQALREQLNGRGDRVPLIAHYAGRLRLDDLRISEAQLNTDNNHVIEYNAPINHRLEKAGRVDWFVGQQFLNFVGPYLNEDTLSVDPYLSNINSSWYDAIQAGYYLQASYTLKDQRDIRADGTRASFESLLKKAATALE